HTAWLDDPRLCSALGRSDFSFGDLKRRKMTVYLAIPPDRLRVCFGFVRGFIGLALDGVIDSPARPAHRIGFFLDEFGQLGRMDRLADSITLLRGYGAQLWVFVQDLSQLKAVYPRWQSFLASTSQQFFGTADYDTPATSQARSANRPSASRQRARRSPTPASANLAARPPVSANISRAVRCSPRTKSCASVPRRRSS